jgi:hypothetical protein
MTLGITKLKTQQQRQPVYSKEGWVKLLNDIHLEDQGRDGRMTMGHVLQKL